MSSESLPAGLAFQARDVWKYYYIGERQQFGTLREAIVRATTYPLHRLRNLRGKGFGSKTTRFAALKDVGFEVAEGESVGIIGKNGAGKSTILKILSRITEPSKGTIKVRGRVSSLLEVGTGFHPELTGRENVYLNGAILGMGQAEVRSKFDEIVGFAQVERFIDTPVKRYSSGMRLRLAFSVAAHLEPDILLVDEVLAVGDAAFQARCLGRLGDVRREGRTVVFVSHDMRAISRLCDRVYWLDDGRIRMNGGASEVIRTYLAEGTQDSLRWTPESSGGSSFSYREVRLEGPNGEPLGDASSASGGLVVVFEYEVTNPIPPGRLALLIIAQDGTTVFGSANTDDETSPDRPWEPGRWTERCRIPGHLLAPGRYLLTISEPDGEGGNLIHEGVLTFSVGRSDSLVLRDGRGGVVAPLLNWDRCRG